MTLISIITPTFNSQSTIRVCIDSVLKQSYQRFEHIVVDNQSIDRTCTIIKDIYNQADRSDQLKMTCEKDTGIADAFNKGIRISSGEVIGFLNSDDSFIDDESLLRIAQPFEDPDLLFVHGSILLTDRIYGSSIRRPLECRITRAMPFNHPTLYFRKEVYTRFGEYDTRYKIAMDYEFIIRLFRQNPTIFQRGKRIDGKPLIHMQGGGVSWKLELQSLQEIRQAFQENGFWNLDSIFQLYLRKFRAKIKFFLRSIRFLGIVHLWRKWKWQ